MTKKHKIPFFDYPQVYLEDREDFLKIFDEISSRGAFILQKEVEEFERNLTSFTGAKYSIGVGNATDGLEIAWMSIGLNQGDEVICSAHTMIATASAIKAAGGTPIPVDINDSGLIDCEAINNSINSRTVGIMPTQLNGRICEMDKIMDIAKKNKLFVVEDAAQALGSTYKGKHAGTFGDAAAISFYPAKLLGCFGDAGAVITNNENYFDRMYQLHDHGRNLNGEIRSWGRNSRMDNLQAAILNFKLNKFKEDLKRRREIASIYHQKLSDLEELKLPRPPSDSSDYFDSFQNYELEADRRNELQEYLFSKGISTLVQWSGKAIHQWDSLGFNVKLPRVEKFFEDCIMIPMNTFLSNDDLEIICDNIRSFYRD